ncbi:MAG TPA: hypothetical protein VFC78_15335 [Tepidisphaeraceae bacterium]|nr:hypothetical protein [Tepidisphaeraceae bacterium]
MRSQVHARLPGLGYDVLASRLGFLECRQKVRAQFREDRHEPLAAAFMVFGLGTSDADTIVFPIHVGPGQRQVFGWAAQPRKPAQGEQQTPLCIRAGVQYLRGVGGGNEPLAGLVGGSAGLHVGEGIVADHLPPHALLEDLPGQLDPLADGRLGQSIGFQLGPPLIGLQAGNRSRRRCRLEVLK